ncbi:MAG: HDOD domain-containing protein [Myxococcota bacterium]
MISRVDIQSHTHSLPGLPASVAQLIGMLGDERASISDFEGVIRMDPGLSVNLLRLANSSWFGLPREVVSVKQAVGLLGTRRLLEIATGAGFRQILPDWIPGYGMTAEGFWLHSVAVAMLAERIAERLRLELPDLTFTAGLLHDIGKLVVASVFEGREALFRGELLAGSDSVTAERTLFGIEHAEAGAELADAWGLPERLLAPIRHHHHGLEHSTETEQRLVDLIHTADALACVLGFSDAVGALARTVDSAVVERLGLRVQDLEGVACEALEPIQEMASRMCGASGGAP